MALLNVVILKLTTMFVFYCILHIDIFNFIPYYHIMDYTAFSIFLPRQNAPFIFTIFHALIFSTTFCIIAFRIFMVFYFMLHAFSL